MKVDQNPKLDHSVFWPAAITVLAVVVIVALFPEFSGKASNAALNWCTYKLDWLFQLGAFGALIFLLWLAYGRYGQIKLGSPGEEPEFSNLAYVSMIFCSGVGSGLIYWAIAEPIYYLSGPPFGAEAGSVEASKWLTTYPMFHWGITAWALYCIPAVPLAYSFYVRKRTNLRLSEACRGILGDHVDGWLGILIDILGIFGIIGGVGTGLGFAVPLLSTTVSILFGIPESMWLHTAILAIWVTIFGTSVYLGLYKGIQILSKINIYSAFGLLIFALIGGPTFFILSNVSETLSVMFQNYFRMSLWTDPVGKSGFAQGWTIFYWAWYLAYLALMGIFVARTSKGRTIRQVITAELIWGSLGCWVFIWVFAGLTEYIAMNDLLPLNEIVKEKGITNAMVQVISTLPGTQVVLFLFIIIEFIFMATTMDSSSFVMATMTTKNMVAEGKMQPARWNRLFWAFALGAMGLAVILIGGMKAVQSLAVVTGLPMLFVAVLMNMSLMKWIREDYGELLAPKTHCIDMSNKTNKKSRL